MSMVHGFSKRRALVSQAAEAVPERAPSGSFKTVLQAFVTSGAMGKPPGSHASNGSSEGYTLLSEEIERADFERKLMEGKDKPAILNVDIEIRWLPNGLRS
ncbi:hypothetical protein KC19_4G045600 [Ceratodon purpureus]|uniref:Uncharacterized protein n=1 Tax=Ceratodon purpureus TaxID=3225 RepID=A0A8T0I8B9_CERPU|nr:hypothetical protein KC19_4G045600 [Ceratodon purpureus]